MIRRRPSPTLFPYTTLFRSGTWSSRDGRPSLLARRECAWSPPACCSACRTARRPAPPRDRKRPRRRQPTRSEEHTSELQSQSNLVCRLLLEKKKINHVVAFI